MTDHKELRTLAAAVDEQEFRARQAETALEKAEAERDQLITAVRPLIERDPMIVHGPCDPFVRISGDEFRAIKNAYEALATPHTAATPEPAATDTAEPKAIKRHGMGFEYLIPVINHALADEDEFLSPEVTVKLARALAAAATPEQEHYLVHPSATLTPEEFATEIAKFNEAAKDAKPMDRKAIDAQLRDARADSVQVRTPGTVEVCTRHATGHDCKGEMDYETGRVDAPCGFYLCPIRPTSPDPARATEEREGK